MASLLDSRKRLAEDQYAGERPPRRRRRPAAEAEGPPPYRSTNDAGTYDFDTLAGKMNFESDVKEALSRRAASDGQQTGQSRMSRNQRATAGPQTFSPPASSPIIAINTNGGGTDPDSDDMVAEDKIISCWTRLERLISGFVRRALPQKMPRDFVRSAKIEAFAEFIGRAEYLLEREESAKYLLGTYIWHVLMGNILNPCSAFWAGEDAKDRGDAIGEAVFKMLDRTVEDGKSRTMRSRFFCWRAGTVEYVSREFVTDARRKQQFEDLTVEVLAQFHPYFAEAFDVNISEHLEEISVLFEEVMVCAIELDRKMRRAECLYLLYLVRPGVADENAVENNPRTALHPDSYRASADGSSLPRRRSNIVLAVTPGLMKISGIDAMQQQVVKKCLVWTPRPRPTT